MRITFKFWLKLTIAVTFGILLAKIIEFLLLTFIGLVIMATPTMVM